MKKASCASILMFGLLCAMSGCSRNEKVIVTPGSISAAYESLGELQIEQSVSSFSFANMRNFLAQMVIFNKYPNAGQGKYLQKRLDSELMKTAKKRYGADAVIHVQYWPDLNAAKFPQGKIYAKGNMVRYKHFPA